MLASWGSSQVRTTPSWVAVAVSPLGLAGAVVARWGAGVAVGVAPARVRLRRDPVVGGSSTVSV